MIVVLKSTLAILAVFVALMGILGYVQTRREVETFASAEAEDALVTARSLRPMVEEVWQGEGAARARQALERANASLPELTLRWETVDDFLPTLDAAAGATLKRGEDVTLLEHARGGVGRVRAVVPLGGPDSRWALEVARTLTEEGTVARAAIVGQVLGGVALAVGGTAVASLVGLWFVGRPMRRLVEQARRIGDGDFAHRSTVTQKDEVGFLAREMESMADRLAQAQRTLAANNEERIRVLEQLRHADRLTTVGTLAAGIAHELGTPLNVVGGRAKMIISGGQRPEQTVDSARIIAAQVDRMVRILRQLLDFARRGESVKQAVELKAIAERTTSLLETLARRHGIVIELSCAGAQDKTSVLADPPQLEQVLTNLIVNGIQAMDHGVLRVNVERLRETPPPDHGGPQGEFVRVEVRDEGLGIAHELLPRVFEPFFTTKPVGEGTGLGLSVAYGIVRDHGGWMSVTSEPGAGTVFSVHLPAAEAG
jgi:signal transduction histidine kinase